MSNMPPKPNPLPVEKLAALIAELAPQFTHASGQHLQNLIQHTILRLGQTNIADRVFLGLVNPEQHRIEILNRWETDRLIKKPQTRDHFSAAHVPWIYDQLRQQKSIVIDTLEQLPGEALQDRAFLAQLGVHSLLIAPLKCQTLLGFLGLDTLQTAHSWTKEEIFYLSQLALLIGQSLQREKELSELQQNTKMYRLLLNTLKAGVVISQKDQFIFANHTFAEMLGYQDEEVIGLDYRRIFTEQGIKLLLERQNKRRLGLPVSNIYQTTFKCKDGCIIDVEINSVITEYNGAPATFAIIQDISEEKRQAQIRQELEFQLLKSQRKTDLALLAANLTHHVKEQLTIIMGRAQLLKTHHPNAREADLIITKARLIQKIFDSYLEKINSETNLEPTFFNFNKLLSIELLLLESDPFFKNQVTKKIHFARNLPDFWGIYSDFASSLVTFLQFAIERLREAEPKSLDISTQAEEDTILITIQVSSQIFQQQEIETLMVPQFAIAPSTTAALDQKIIDRYKIYKAYGTLTRYQAQIDIQSSPSSGTSIIIRIPFSHPPAVPTNQGQ